MATLRSCLAFLLCLGIATAEIKNQGWWRHTVFYQVYPRSFMDSNGDGIGDLKGITNKLQHFKDSGIGAIWLSPIYASPMIDFGYDISDFRDIDEAYGTMEDFQELTKKAKEMGIKVIMDLVPNHTSDKHEWFMKSLIGQGKYKDYYVWRQGKNNNGAPPNNWISVFSGPAWTYNADRSQWYFHQFEYRQPDLNYSNPNVRREMEEIIEFWLDKGVDGFRIDAVPHIYEADNLPDEPLSKLPGISNTEYKYLNHIYTKDDPRTYELVKSWRKIVDDWANKRNEDEKVILTEAYTSLENTTRFYYYGSHVPFNFNFIMNVNKDSKPQDFKKVIQDWMSHTPTNTSANWVMGNHDRSRTASRYPGRADQMTMLAMILPGIAVTYNGEEIAMEDKSDISWDETQDPQACNTDPDRYVPYSRDPNRTPFQWDETKNAGFSTGSSTWLPIHNNYKTLNLAAQKKDPQSHYNLYRQLTSLRASSATLKSISLITDILNNEEVLVVARQSKESSIVLIINFSDVKSQKVNIAKYASGATKAEVYVSSVGSNIKWKSEVSTSDVQVPAKASLILISKTSKDENKTEASGDNKTGGANSATVPVEIIFIAALLTLFKFK